MRAWRSEKYFRARCFPPRLLSIAVAAFVILVAADGALILRSTGTMPAPTTPPGSLGAHGPVAGEAMRWRPVAIGGGGFITGFSWDIAGKTRVVRTDVYGAYRWDVVANRWRQLVVADAMPLADRVQDGVADGVYEIAVAPNNAARIYMAVRNQVYRSDDGGAHWAVPAGAKPSTHFEPNGPFRLGGPFMAVSPTDPNLVLLGTPDAGLWRSRDGAANWERLASVPPSINNDPTSKAKPPGIVLWFAPKTGALWAASAGHGIYVGDVRGDAFQPLSPGPGPLDIARGAFADDDTFYAAAPGTKSLWRHDSAGWSDLARRGAVVAAAFVTVAVDPATGAILAGDQGGRLQCSFDGGTSWNAMRRSIAVGKGEPPWLRVADKGFFATAQIAFDPVEPGRLWTAAGTGVYTASSVAACGGLTWQSQTRGIEEIVANDVVQAAGRAPVFAGWDFGIHVKPNLDADSTTYGPRERVLIAAQQVDWTPSRPGFLVTNASDTRTCCAEDGQAVLAGYSDDGGLHWTRFASLPTPPGTTTGDPWRMAYGSIAVSSDNPDNIVWAPAKNRAPFYTLDRGATWRRVIFENEQLPNTGSFGAYHLARKSVTADRVLPHTFYLLHSGTATNPGLAGIWRSSNGGASWTRIFLGEVAPDSAFSAKLRAVPGKAGHLFFTSGTNGSGDTRLRRSTDGGQSWSTLDEVTRVDDIGFGQRAVGAPYPTLFISGRVKGSYGIWRSVDGAARWHRLVDFPLGSLDQVTVVEGDKNVFGRVYIGYKGSGWIYGEPAPCARAAPGVRGGPAQQCRAVE